MIISQSCAVGRYIFRKKNVVFSFQGHYVNRQGSALCHCQGIQQQNRSFINLPITNKTRVYTGRQLVGYTMEQMFEVVSDVGSYNKFLPWCKKSIVLKETPGNLKADLIIGFPPINESYTSNVTLVKPHLVKAECSDGRLFHHMLTLWRFSPGLKREQQSCVVDFQITFEFRSAIHSHLSNLFFDQVARQMEGAFIKEVGRRNGPATMQPRKLLINNHTLKT
ncbi:coenzyme Q-binding protein COQ10 homolog A, mitochondrial isoform X2 [Bombyx mandarina]|uniref:Coenzyme Q-binding protein COQ10 START domain-containing protein n=2 Tax=Bombyx TaxID=7090 RepID=A0A8R1WK30_BOMMO|nr:coenzyme Q-binding protein COQ10 homolog A, mitochondrial isoform X2 [Bombyx mori]XP_028037914.1 coenzyme Q-binding protein COQ10 homolog A, mitochondrial isoform X2 [Bombyx mandarina]